MRDTPGWPQFVEAKTIPDDPDGKHPIVIVDRVHPLGLPPLYCVHGTTQCYKCRQWCNLGTETYEAVLQGVHPVCLECATEIWEDLQARGIEPPAPVLQVKDHLRSEGPHE